MGAANLLLALLFGAVGLYCIYFFTRPIFLHLAPFFFQAYSKTKDLKNKKSLEEIDELISNESFELACIEIKNSVLLNINLKQADPKALKPILQNLLSRILIISDEKSVKVSNIAELEGLFMERIELLALEQKTRSAYTNILHKRERAGKSTPSWSKDDYKNKQKEISNELNRNKTECEKILEVAIESLGHNKEESTLYH